jgi:hypothetical protein
MSTGTATAAPRAACSSTITACPTRWAVRPPSRTFAFAAPPTWPTHSRVIPTPQPPRWSNLFRRRRSSVPASWPRSGSLGESERLAPIANVPRGRHKIERGPRDPIKSGRIRGAGSMLLSPRCRFAGGRLGLDALAARLGGGCTGLGGRGRAAITTRGRTGLRPSPRSKRPGLRRSPELGGCGVRSNPGVSGTKLERGGSGPGPRIQRARSPKAGEQVGGW